MYGGGEGDDCAERSAAHDRSSILAMVVPSVQSTEGIFYGSWQSTSSMKVSSLKFKKMTEQLLKLRKSP